MSLGAGKDWCWCETTQANNKAAYTTDLPMPKNKKWERCSWVTVGKQSPRLLSQRGTEVSGRGSVGKRWGWT